MLVGLGILWFVAVVLLILSSYFQEVKHDHETADKIGFPGVALVILAMILTCIYFMVT